MSSAFEPVSGDQVHGEVVAQISVAGTDLMTTGGLVWERGADGLDEFSRAALRVGGGPPAALLAYDNDPDRSILVVMEPTDEFERDLDRLLAALDIPPSAVIGRGRQADPPAQASLPAASDGLKAEVERQRREIERLTARVEALLAATDFGAQAFPVTFGGSGAEDAAVTAADHFENVIGVDFKARRRRQQATL